MERQPKIGETVLYYPAKAFSTASDPANPFAKKTEDPDKGVKTNGNEEGPVPALITRIFGNGGPELPLINVTIFPDQGGLVFRSSVTHKSKKADGQAHWTYSGE